MEAEEIRACNHMIITLSNLQCMWHDMEEKCFNKNTQACKEVIGKIDILKNDINQLRNAGCVTNWFAEGLKAQFEEDVKMAKEVLGRER